MPRPHDLLYLDRPDAFQAAGARPGWLADAALQGAPLVVRREATAPDIVPVGARALARNQRCAGYVPANAIERIVTPEMLARLPCAAALPYTALPCLAALRALAPLLDALGLAWGPAGGVGFYLASGLPVLRADSDLDLLVRLPRRPAPALLADLCALLDHQPSRIDVQLDTPGGGCALLDAARGGRVLVKTGTGPVLTRDPWNVAA